MHQLMTNFFDNIFQKWIKYDIYDMNAFYMNILSILSYVIFI